MVPGATEGAGNLYEGIDIPRCNWADRHGGATVVLVMSREPIVSIVDDDESIRQALQGLLRSTGRGVEAFASAEDFLHAGRLPAVACLILDLQMPGMGGLELQRTLAAGGHRIPTIVLTAHGDHEVRRLALAAGAVAFLGKPFDPDTLLSVVDAALGTGQPPRP